MQVSCLLLFGLNAFCDFSYCNFRVYSHSLYTIMYFISAYISGEVTSLSFRQMPNIVYIHDFRRR